MKITQLDSFTDFFQFRVFLLMSYDRMNRRIYNTFGSLLYSSILSISCKIRRLLQDPQEEVEDSSASQNDFTCDCDHQECYLVQMLVSCLANILQKVFILIIKNAIILQILVSCLAKIRQSLLYINPSLVFSSYGIH